MVRIGTISLPALHPRHLRALPARPTSVRCPKGGTNEAAEGMVFRVNDAGLSPEVLAFWRQLALDTAPLIRYRAERAARQQPEAPADGPDARPTELTADVVQQAAA